MVVIICGKYGNNRSRTENVTERTRFSKSRSNDLEDISQGQRSSHATHLLIVSSRIVIFAVIALEYIPYLYQSFILYYNVFHGYPVEVLFLWLDSLYQLSIFFFTFLFCFCVPFHLLFSSLFFFLFNLLLLKFANHVAYAWFIVHDPDTIIG